MKYITAKQFIRILRCKNMDPLQQLIASRKREISQFIKADVQEQIQCIRRYCKHMEIQKFKDQILSAYRSDLYDDEDFRGWRTTSWFFDFLVCFSRAIREQSFGVGIKKQCHIIQLRNSPVNGILLWNKTICRQFLEQPIQKIWSKVIKCVGDLQAVYVIPEEWKIANLYNIKNKKQLMQKIQDIS